jgi:hypothetical protein
MDAKIAAAEARTDVKLRDVDVKFERLMGEVRLGFQELRTDMASFKGEVGAQLAAMPTRAEAQSIKLWIIGTIIATGVALAALVAPMIIADRANILSAFQAALAVASAKQASQVELPLAQPTKTQAPVVVPAPGAETPVTLQPKPAP